MALVRQRLLVFFVPLLLAVPFLNRAYFVDDSYFVEIASWLKDNPQLPYHFRADDAGLQNRGWEEDGFVRMVNPLVHQYYLALLIKIGGAREWFLRFGCVLLSCFSALFLFEFARRWTQTPLMATFLMLVTPALWMTSYSLLIDSTMVFFAFGAVYFFIKATESDKWSFLFLSGIFSGLAILTKYPAVFVLPLTWTYLVLRWNKLNRQWRYFVPGLIGLAFLIGYSLWTSTLYGRPHILAASARMVHVFGWPKILSLAVFFSGSFLLPLMAWSAASARMRIITLLPVMVGAFFLSSKLGGFSLAQGGLMSLWLVTSFLFVIVFWAQRSAWIYPRDHFLFLWLIGFALMMLIVMDWVAVRYFCLVAPAMGLIAVRMMEIRYGSAAPGLLKLFLIITFLFTSVLAMADYRQAEPSRLVGTQLKAKGFNGGERHFYLGDSFTMSYLKQDGWVPCFPQTEFRAGDLVLAKEVTMPLIWFVRKGIPVRELAVFEYPSHLPIKVMDYSGSAGFYASVWGALPFTFSTGPWERFHLFEIIPAS